MMFLVRYGMLENYGTVVSDRSVLFFLRVDSGQLIYLSALSLSTDSNVACYSDTVENNVYHITICLLNQAFQM
jgi:hypothetical protein